MTNDTNNNPDSNIMDKRVQYAVEIYFSKTDELIGYAVFGSEKTLETYEENNYDYDIIFDNNKNQIYGKTSKNYIEKEEKVTIEKSNVEIKRIVVKKIWVSKYSYQDQTTDEVIVIE